MTWGRPSPVVGRREDGDAFSVVRHLVALGLHLVAADDEIQAVPLQEAARHVGTKLTADASLTERAAVLRGGWGEMGEMEGGDGRMEEGEMGRGGGRDGGWKEGDGEMEDGERRRNGNERIEN